MPTHIVQASQVAEEFIKEITLKNAEFDEKPVLVGFLANDDPAAKKYALWTGKTCEATGIKFELRQVDRNDLEAAIVDANEDDKVHGIMVYYPVFGGTQDQYIQNTVSYKKDVEGLNHKYIYNMYHNIRYLDKEQKQKCIIPCTPLAIVKILEYIGVYNKILPYGNRLHGRTITVINRSEVVGRPLAALLANDGAKVFSVDEFGLLEFHRGENIKLARHQVIETKVTLDEALAQSDVVITGVPSPNYKLPATKLKDGVIAVNFSTFKNMGEDVQEKASIFVPSVAEIDCSKPKTAAGHRALKKREPVAEEGAKTAVFLKGTTTSQIVSDALKDLYALKKPDAVMFSKRNDIRPFEDHKPFEFFSQKNDASLFVFGTHSKKRPHNLTIVRMFDYQMMDMIELGIENYKGLKEFKNIKASLGNRPLILFNGENWDANDDLRTIKSMFLDMYTGDTSMEQLNLKGITHAMVFTITGTVEKPKIFLRVYNILLKKSGVRLPRVELEEMGPELEFSKRRITLANMDMMKEALRVPNLNKPKKEKNIEKNEFGEKTGRIWMEKQDLSKMQTRKMKGLKRKAAEAVDEEESNDE
ncbi:hypothetical protein HK103_002674 [Boothiomyces macroporosus]|uniref:Ribosome production factor 2 homolog n=1 Tax=Boothiomyces macroporosus TaxID=261099 RepID=A0AAD5UMM8_9FUNG|nr:hypothetical protein HK103_002674 [Boothiomyces macroporosus]